MVYLQRVSIIDNFDTFAYILFRHAVMVKLESYIAVPHYRCRAPLLHLVAYGTGSGRRYSASICSRLDRERPFILRPLKAESDSKMATFKDSRELNTSSSTSAYTAGKAVSRHFQPTPCPWDGVPVRGIRYIHNARKMPQTPR